MRQLVRDVLSGQSREIVDAAEVMACELATNCVRHARTDFELTIHSQGQIRVEVRDTGQGRPMPRSPTLEEPTGRGLRIVEAMSDSWGVIPFSDGKTVWFTLPQRPRMADEASLSTAASERVTEGSDQPYQGRSGHRDADTPDRARRTPKGALADKRRRLRSPWSDCAAAVRSRLASIVDQSQLECLRGVIVCHSVTLVGQSFDDWCEAVGGGSDQALAVA